MCPDNRFRISEISAGVSGPKSRLALQQVRRRVQQEWKQQAVGLGGVERAFQRARRRTGIAQRVVDDRLQQQRQNLRPSDAGTGEGPLDYRRERCGRARRVVLGESELG